MIFRTVENHKRCKFFCRVVLFLDVLVGPSLTLPPATSQAVAGSMTSNDSGDAGDAGNVCNSYAIDSGITFRLRAVEVERCRHS